MGGVSAPGAADGDDAAAAAVVDRLARDLGRFRFDRLYGNFAEFIPADASTAVQQSAQRHIDWVRGHFDHLT